MRVPARLSRKAIIVCGCVFAIAPGLSPAAVDTEVSVKAARKAARRDTRSREGQEWERRHNSWLGPALTPVAQRCMRDAPTGKDNDFAIYLQWTTKGSVAQSAVEPISPFTTCFREGASQLTYPEVPREGFWFEVKMHRHGKSPDSR